MDEEFSVNMTGTEFDEIRTWRMFLFAEDVILSLITLVGSVCDLIIIYAICKYKTMRTKRNLLIINWAAADFLLQVLSPTKFQILSFLFDLDIPFVVGCLLHSASSNFLTLEFTVVLILAFNCIYKRINLKNIKVLSLVLWFLALLCNAGSSFLCFHHHSTDVLFIACIMTFLLLFISFCGKVCVYSKRRMQHKEKHTKLRYILTTVFTLCWFLMSLIVTFRVRVDLGLAVEMMLGLFAYSVALLNPLINIYILAKYDKNFKLCFKQLFKFTSETYIEDTITYENDSEDNINITPNLSANVAAND